MNSEQILDGFIARQLDIIRSIQNGAPAMSIRDQVELLNVGIKSLRDLIDIKHLLESNRSTGIVLASTPFVSHEGKPADIAVASTPVVSYEGKASDIIRSFKEILQTFKKANLMQQ